MYNLPRLHPNSTRQPRIFVTRSTRRSISLIGQSNARPVPEPDKTTTASFLQRIFAYQHDLTRFLKSQRQKHSEHSETLEDKLHDVYVTAGQKSERFDNRGDVGKWALGIAANREREAERGAKRNEARFSEDEDALESSVAPTSSPELQAHYRELQIRVLRALKKLPPDLFAALFMIAFEGHSHEEAAKELGISDVLLRKRLQRARAFLMKEAGMTREDINSVMPPLLGLDDGEVPLLLRLQRFIIGSNVGGNMVGVIAIGLFASAQPAQKPDLALTGLHSIHFLLGSGAADSRGAKDIEPATSNTCTKREPSSQGSVTRPRPKNEPAEPIVIPEMNTELREVRVREHD